MNGGYQINTEYTNPSNTDYTYMSVYSYSDDFSVEIFCNRDALFYSKLLSSASSTQNTFTRSTSDDYICVMHAGDCGKAFAKEIFTCPKSPAKSSLSSIITIFLPSLIFFIFFLAIIVHLLKRRIYQQVSLEDTSDNPQQGTTVVPTSPQDYEMSNIGTPVYPVMQMTNANGQTVYMPHQFAAPPTQVYTNNGIPVVYVDPSTNLSSVYVATNPLPPQY